MKTQWKLMADKFSFNVTKQFTPSSLYTEQREQRLPGTDMHIKNKQTVTISTSSTNLASPLPPTSHNLRLTTHDHHGTHRLVVGKSGSELQFEPEPLRTGPEVRFKVQKICWTKLQVQFRVWQRLLQFEPVRTQGFSRPKFLWSQPNFGLTNSDWPGFCQDWSH